MIRRQARQQAPKLSEPLGGATRATTIEDAVRAAQSLNSDLEQQVAIAAGLMGVPHEEVGKPAGMRLIGPPDFVGKGKAPAPAAPIIRKG